MTAPLSATPRQRSPLPYYSSMKTLPLLLALCLAAFSARADDFLHSAAFATPTPAAPTATAPTGASRDVPTVAVMASFPAELAAIELAMVPDASAFNVTKINGNEFKTATVNGRRFVFFLTGMSLVNAAMNTQLALDKFNVSAVFFSGIAGGIDPSLHPGDVVIPARWAYHGETVYLNETAPGKFALPGWYKPKGKNFGMIHPDQVTVLRDGMTQWEQLPSFPADEMLLTAAKRSTDTLPPLKMGDQACKIAYGGDGVSGTVFCDNAEYRKWVFENWKAVCLDMESTAIAQVCWENKKPFLIVRGLSDLAGGQSGENQMGEYLKAAADHSAAVLTRILQNLDPVAPLTADSKL